MDLRRARDEAGLWLADHRGVLPIPLVGLALAAWALIAMPTGPSEHQMGLIVGFGQVSHGRGTGHTASVRVFEDEVTITLPQPNQCRIGEWIEVWRRPHMLGRSYTAYRGCEIGSPTNLGTQLSSTAPARPAR